MSKNNWIIIGALTIFLVGCSHRLHELESVKIDRSLCAKEAVQLIKKVNCFDKPIDDSSKPVVLKADSFVYLCHKHQEWVAVMYPYPDEAIDCNFRSSNQQCQIGWVKDALLTRSFD